MQWVNSTNGPDWTDVLLFMAEVEKTHLCTIWIHMCSAGSLGAAGWRLTAIAQLIVVDGTVDAPTYGEGMQWPNSTHKTIPGAVYALLARLDWTLGQELHGQKR